MEQETPYYCYNCERIVFLSSFICNICDGSHVLQYSEYKKTLDFDQRLDSILRELRLYSTERRVMKLSYTGLDAREGTLVLHTPSTRITRIKNFFKLSNMGPTYAYLSSANLDSTARERYQIDHDIHIEQDFYYDDEEIDNLIESIMKEERDRPRRNTYYDHDFDYLNKSDVRRFYAIKNGVCSICYERYLRRDEGIMLKCSHFYHRDCILDWIAKHRSCPVCRQSVDIIRDLVIRPEVIYYFF